MSKLLAQLLGASGRDFQTFIDRLEKACLNPGVDIRLSAEVNSKTREKIRELGLDPADTAPKELYFALQTRLKKDDNELAATLKIGGKSPTQIMRLLANQAEQLSRRELVLCITSSGAKRILQAVPPRKTLRALKLRSLDAVLKREDVRVLYALATKIEDPSWQSQAHARMKRLPAKDIAWQSAAVACMPEAWYEKITKTHELRGLMLTCSEAGTVIMLPVLKKIPEGGVVLTLGLMLQATQRLAIESMPYRQQIFMQSYHNILPEIAHQQQPELPSLHGIKPTWQAVYELVARGHMNRELPEAEFLLDDFSWATTEMKIASLLPSFDFWVDSHYLAVAGENIVVPLHVLDIARSVVVKAAYGAHTNTHLEQSLWNELHLRYLQQENLLRALQKQLQPSFDDVVLLP